MHILVLGDLSSFHTPRWVYSLKELLPDGKVTAISLEPFGGVDDAIYINPRFKNLRLRYITSIHRVSKKIRELNPDILNPIHLPNYGLLASFAKLNLPVYLALWGSDILESSEKSPLHRLFTYHIVHKADHIAVDADIMKNILKDKYGYPEEKITVMTWGVPEYMRNIELEPLNKPPEKWIVFTHRRFEPHMDPATVVRAFKEVLRYRENVDLVMASDGSIRNDIIKLAQDLSIDKQIHFPGRLSDSKLVEYLRSSHIYVSASTIDSTSVSLLEAMACGLFPIVSDIPANREWIIDRLNGFLFPVGNYIDLANRILEAIQRPEFVDQAVKINKSLIREKACWECHVKKAISIMERLIWQYKGS